MDAPEDPLFSSTNSVSDDPIFKQQLKKLHELTVYGRWLAAGLLWICLAPIGLWGLRSEVALWQDYFTWTSVRYGLAYNPLPAFGLALCIGATVTVLIWQSRNILVGISNRQIKRLEKQLLRIRQQGPSHPLWKWVCKE